MAPSHGPPASVAAVDTPGDEVSGAPFCTGCGRSRVRCAGCGRALDPPRYCDRCGRRLAVVVTPTGYTARCRDHGVALPSPVGD